MAVTKGRNPLLENISATDRMVDLHTGADSNAASSAVAEIARQRNMTRKQRKEAERQRNRTRLVIDVDPNIKKIVEHLANMKPTVPVSDLCEFILIMGLRTMDEEKTDLAWARRATRSMRFDATLANPPIPNSFLELVGLPKNEETPSKGHP